MLIRRLSVLLVACLAALNVQAQDALQPPAQFLGYELGERFTPHHRVVDYVEHVAALSPNVRLEPYGTTNEGRPLMVAYVASSDHLERLETIRTDNLKRAGLLEGTLSEADGPALVWLSYNVHGNESVSTEAAMQTLYDLADPQNGRTQRWLDDVVVIIDPVLNPDGRDRYVHWYQQVRGEQPNAEPDAREHHEPWPGGRTNHYYFDLNRDWAWATQRETQQRLPLYNRWMPHVHVDFHEQGVEAPYYFAPAAEPFHEQITDWQRAFQTTIGANNTRYFDEEGWLYFTRQRFDLLYPGYGDTWPTFNGAVGMTYEQGGSGRAGLAIRTAEDDTLTLRDRIAHHYTTGLATIEATAQNREEVVRAFARYFDEAPAPPYRAYLVKVSSGTDRVRALAEHLDRQGIRYGYAAGGDRARGVGYDGDENVRVDVEPGDLVVPADQPKARLARVLFEPRTTLADSLTYDITAWALPYVYGLDAYALTDAVATGGASPQPAASDLDVARPYAYLAEWQSFEDLRLLIDLLNAGVRTRFAEKPFEVGGRSYGRGTLIVTRRGNEALGERFDRVVREAAAALGQPLHAVATGYVTSGADFGSGDVPFLKAPRVAALSGEATSAYALGNVWHFFDQQLGYPLTLIDGGDLGDMRLSDYDVLILPSGYYADVVNDARLDDLKGWVRGGGRLVVMGRAASFLAGKDDFALKGKKNEGEEDGDIEKADSTAPLRVYAERERDAIQKEVPGAIFRVQLDATHPLAFGYDGTYYTLKSGNDAFAFLGGNDGWNVGVLREDALVSGFAGHEAQQRLTDTLVFGTEEMGRGDVVYLVDNPLFRGFWYDGRLLFGNAVFLVGQE